MYTELDYTLRLWAHTSASRAISAVAEHLVYSLIRVFTMTKLLIVNNDNYLDYSRDESDERRYGTQTTSNYDDHNMCVNEIFNSQRLLTTDYLKS